MLLIQVTRVVLNICFIFFLSMCFFCFSFKVSCVSNYCISGDIVHLFSNKNSNANIQLFIFSREILSI